MYKVTDPLHSMFDGRSVIASNVTQLRSEGSESIEIKIAPLHDLTQNSLRESGIVSLG